MISEWEGETFPRVGEIVNQTSVLSVEWDIDYKNKSPRVVIVTIADPVTIVPG